MRPRLTVTAAPAAVAGALLADHLAEVVGRRGRARFGVPGGSTAGPVLAWLGRHLDRELTDRLTVTWVDERHLPWHDDWRDLDPETNLRGTWEAWFRHLPSPPDHLPMLGTGTLEQARHAYERAFVSRLGGLDVAFLGAGPDGHVASLFPGHRALSEPGPCVAVDDSPKPPPQRLTLSLPVLQAADACVVVVRGEAKAPMLARAWAGDDDLPVVRARPRTHWHWVVDPAAASLLPEEVLP